ncbi:MAG TPA: SRPBCC family protein [Nitrospiraceae bacterium]|jgi:uncharacterized membrane protein
MSNITTSIEVNVPVKTAYNQWTQFEEFPRFMKGVKEVRQVDDKRLHWKAEIGGREKEWDAEITAQTPDKRIAWKTIGGANNQGIVTFEPISESKSKIDLHIAYEPEGVVDTMGDELGAVELRVKEDLERFKTFIEERGKETGAWRGKV